MYELATKQPNVVNSRNLFGSHLNFQYLRFQFVNHSHC